jgi:hypothetical protein
MLIPLESVQNPSSLSTQLALLVTITVQKITTQKVSNIAILSSAIPSHHHIPLYLQPVYCICDHDNQRMVSIHDSIINHTQFSYSIILTHYIMCMGYICVHDNQRMVSIHDSSICHTQSSSYSIILTVCILYGYGIHMCS